MENQSSKLKIIGGLVIALALIWGITEWRQSRKISGAELDDFAQCLTDRGYMMYGAYWCSHCQNEKKGFGPSAWKRVNYIECTKEPKQCLDAGIKGYPTWLGPEGTRLEGEQGVGRLSEVSGCPLY